MSPSDTSLEEEEGVDMDGAEWEGGTAKSVCRDLNCALIRLTVAASMAHMTEKLSGGKRNGKMA